MPSKLVSNLDEVKGITAFTFVANRIIGKNILSHLCIKLALMPLKGEVLRKFPSEREEE
jgi:hypothetical protein